MEDIRKIAAWIPMTEEMRPYAEASFVVVGLVFDDTITDPSPRRQLRDWIYWRVTGRPIRQQGNGYSVTEGTFTIDREGSQYPVGF